jgi:hypothetical protein
MEKGHANPIRGNPGVVVACAAFCVALLLPCSCVACGVITLFLISLHY